MYVLFLFLFFNLKQGFPLSISQSGLSFKVLLNVGIIGMSHYSNAYMHSFTEELNQLSGRMQNCMYQRHVATNGDNDTP